MSKKTNKNLIINSPTPNTHRTLLFVLVLLLLSLSIFNLSIYWNARPKTIYAKLDNFEEKSNFWYSFLTVHPDYFQGWIELSKIQINQGDLKLAKESLENAKVLNPNAPEIKSIDSLLEDL